MLLENGQTDAAIQMYCDMHRLDRAVEVATSKAHPNAENLRREHLDWLKQTGQEEAAGAVKEREGDHPGPFASTSAVVCPPGRRGRHRQPRAIHRL